MSPPFVASQPNGRAVTEISVELDGKPSEWEQWFLLHSDHHWDNPECDRKLLERHHREAVERNAGILSFGDLFCCMQGKYDKRSDKRAILPEHMPRMDDPEQRGYFDLLVDTAADWYGRFAENLVLIGIGNHESAIAARHEFDLTRALVSVLKAKHRSPVFAGGYGGYVLFRLKRVNECRTVVLYYHHTRGGSSPVTHGVTEVNRQQVFLDDVDIIVNGHNHKSYHVPFARQRVSKNKGLVMRTEGDAIRCPSYKDEWGDGSRTGWLPEKNQGPTPMGGWWLRFCYRGERFDYDLIRAK